MLNLAILVVVCGIAYRFRGGGILPDKEPSLLHSLRKPIYCIVTGAVFALIAYFSASISALNALISAIIVSLGSFLPPLTSPRPFFNSWRGADATEDTKVNALNWHQHKFAEWVTRRIYGDN